MKKRKKEGDQRRGKKVMKLFKNVEEILNIVKNIEEMVRMDNTSYSKKQLNKLENYRVEIKELKKENKKLNKELAKIKSFYEEEKVVK